MSSNLIVYITNTIEDITKFPNIKQKYGWIFPRVLKKSCHMLYNISNSRFWSWYREFWIIPWAGMTGWKDLLIFFYHPGVYLREIDTLLLTAQLHSSNCVVEERVKLCPGHFVANLPLLCSRSTQWNRHFSSFSSGTIFHEKFISSTSHL